MHLNMQLFGEFIMDDALNSQMSVVLIYKASQVKKNINTVQCNRQYVVCAFTSFIISTPGSRLSRWVASYYDACLLIRCIIEENLLHLESIFSRLGRNIVTLGQESNL